MFRDRFATVPRIPPNADAKAGDEETLPSAVSRSARSSVNSGQVENVPHERGARIVPNTADCVLFFQPLCRR
jgi:hypothetical protein